ncbi:MAG: DUF3110 domain-containing protein [Symploca sp. SIO2G7]|nr:DUF3110 domain-containing protein [Symploca sp. SIO2G7]
MLSPKRVFILLYNVGTENEGVHSLQIEDRTVVLMFESEDDATRYGLLLEAQDFPPVTVEAIDVDEIDTEQFDYDWQLVPAGFVPENRLERLFLAPPEANLERDDSQAQTKETAEEVTEVEMSNLDHIRRQLEGLL